MSTTGQGRSKRGFTLIELLMVVAIIALLVSILLPSLGRARQMANSAICGSNLNGLGKALYMYAQEFDGKFPLAQGIDSGNAQNLTNQGYPTVPEPNCEWYKVLVRYTNTPIMGIYPAQNAVAYTCMYKCPSAPPHPTYTLQGWTVDPVSYMISRRIIYGTYWSRTRWAGRTNPDLVPLPHKQLALADGPIGSQVGWIFIDTNESNNTIWGQLPKGTGSRVWYIHGNKSAVNLLMTDGHSQQSVDCAEGRAMHYQYPVNIGY